MNRFTMIMCRFTFLMLAIIAGTSYAHKKETYDLAPVPQDITQGDTLVLLKPVDVAGGSTVITFQDGKVVEEAGINTSIPYCRLELAGEPGAKLTITPQRFTITEVAYDEKPKGNQGKVLAVTYLAIGPADGVKLKGVSCSWPEASAQPNFVTADDIGATLNGYFSIEVAQ